MEYTEKILILTPVKDGERFIENYLASIYKLTYPHNLISIAFLESDSRDNTYRELEGKIPQLKEDFRSVKLWKKDFGFHIPLGMPRWDSSIQIERRTILAKSRNHLLFRSLNDEDWVLWLDVDVIEYPPNIIEILLTTKKYIVQPNCVKKYGGKSFDLNAWRERGKLHMHDLRNEGDLVKLHAVGGTMLLIKADIHRDGLVFPPFLYGNKNKLIRNNRGIRQLLSQKSRGEIETEGLGIMAHDMGYECWGMPKIEILHRED